MASNSTYPTSYSTTTLSSTIGGVTRSAGSYSARVVGSPWTETTPRLSAAGATIGYRCKYRFTVEGTGTYGTLTGSVSSIVCADMEGEELLGLGSGGSGSGSPLFGNGAMQANGKIKFVTNGGLRISDAGTNRNNADILANEGLGWQPFSGSRSTANANVLDINGQVMTTGSPSAAWSYTTSATTGLYKAANGAVFLSLAGDGAAQNQIAAMTAARDFPSETQVNAWKQEWYNAATGTGSTTYNSGIPNTNSVPQRATNPGQGERRITAPAYINGDLVIDSQQVYLQPNNDLTKPNVIYVKGNVRNAALLYNRGVKLIVEGTFTDTNTSALYSLQTQYSPYASDYVNSGYTGTGNNSNSSGTSRKGTGMDGLYRDAALVTLTKSRTAINFNTNSSGAAGLIYSALGGINVNGNNEVRGALIAGGGADPLGTGTLGDVTVNPVNGNSFVVWYQDEATQGRSGFQASSTTIGGVTTAFAPTRRMYNWVQTK